MKRVDIFTDGACKGNPGPGGWGVLLRMGRHEKELSAGDPHTTNNRMEMTAVIRGLKALIEPCEVTIHSDSRYVIDGMTKWVETYGTSSSRRHGRTGSPGNGSAATTAIPRTNVSTSWPALPPKRNAPDLPLVAGGVHRG
jgi:ribonuclease HI